MPASSRSRHALGLPLVTAAAIVLAGTIGLAMHVASVLREAPLAQSLMGTGLWHAIVRLLGGNARWNGDAVVVEFPQAALVMAIASGSLIAWLAGGAAISRRRQHSFLAALQCWGRAGWLWWLVPLLWEIVGTAADLLDSTSLRVLWQQTLPVCHSVLWAGWLTTFCVLVAGGRLTASGTGGPVLRIPALVWMSMALYSICFSAMNWQLYESL